jgi:hypothetical protein
LIQKFKHNNKFLTKNGTLSLQIHPLFPCFLLFDTTLLDEGMHSPAAHYGVGFPSVLVTVHTLQFGIKYKIAFLSIANEVAFAEIGFTSPAVGSCRSPKRLRTQVLAQHIIRSHRSQHLDCRNRTYS